MNNATHDSDTLEVIRPSWMDQQTWAGIETDTEALLERPLTGPALSGHCAERSWCIANEEEHEDFHTSDIVDLADSDGTGERGWWRWLWEDRGPDGPGLLLGLEGRIEHPGRAENFYASIEVADVASLLRAIATPQARLALEHVLAQATEVGP